MLRIAVLGVGHLGKIHLKCLQGLPHLYQLVGFYDANAAMARQVSEQFGVPAFDTIEELLQHVDVVDIVTPTTTHFDVAKRCIEAGKHIFIEKPITRTVEEGLELCRLAEQYGIKAQVGHVERFNPALLALEGQSLDPKFIEIHRLAMFNPRGTDVSVIEDLMIHDLDIILKFVRAKVAKVHANGVAIVSKAADIATARIEFENGAVANVTASRISMKPMRKFRLFQSDAYISMDFLNKQTEVIRLHNEPNGDNYSELDTALGKKYLEVAMPEAPTNNAIQMELELFGNCIVNNGTPRVTLEDGLEALRLAHWILEEVRRNDLILRELPESAL